MSVSWTAEKLREEAMEAAAQEKATGRPCFLTLTPSDVWALASYIEELEEHYKESQFLVDITRDDTLS